MSEGTAAPVEVFDFVGGEEAVEAYHCPKSPREALGSMERGDTSPLFLLAAHSLQVNLLSAGEWEGFLLSEGKAVACHARSIGPWASRGERVL